MNFSAEELEQLRARLRYKVRYEVGFYCPDVDDIVQETLARVLVATREEKINNPAAVGAFLNGVCRNVISEYRRRNMRDEPMPEVVPEPPGKGIPEADLFELREAIAHFRVTLLHEHGLPWRSGPSRTAHRELSAASPVSGLGR